VVGHEIGHVTARHSVSQMSKAQLAQIGLGLGSVLAPEQAARFGQLAETGLGVAFLKFGRDDERQADDLGLRYLVAAGYDPRPMAGVFDMLDRVSAASGADAVPGWLSTHPAPENRRERAAERIAALDYDFAKMPTGEQAFREQIDGMTFGDDPRQGYFEDTVFLHPTLAFRVEFPAGWKLENSRQAVIGANADGDAIVELTLAAESTPEAALQKFLSQSGLTRTGPAMGSISGLPTAGDGFVAEIEGGRLRGRVGFVAYGGRVFRLLGFAPEYRWSTHEPAIRRALASFDRLTDRRALEIEPRRLRIVRAERAMTLDELARAHGATVPIETLALINRLEPGARLQAGGAYRVVVGGSAP
jgi:predicted Zn-dependent protease